MVGAMKQKNEPLKCPKCGNKSGFIIERCIDGHTICHDCKYKAKHNEFQVPKPNFTPPPQNPKKGLSKDDAKKST